MLVLTPLMASAQSIKGVWQRTETHVLSGPNAGVTTYANPLLLIYTDAYVMWAYDLAAGPRTPLPPAAERSDAQLERAAREYASMGGTYILDGTTITYNRLGVCAAGNSDHYL